MGALNCTTVTFIYSGKYNNKMNDLNHAGTTGWD